MINGVLNYYIRVFVLIIISGGKDGSGWEILIVCKLLVFLNDILNGCSKRFEEIMVVFVVGLRKGIFYINFLLGDINLV